MARKKPAPKTAAKKKKKAAPPQERTAGPAPHQLPFCVVGIGASAGGIEATTALLRALPPDTGLAFVLIQHLDPSHESMLTEILGRATAMRVTEAARQVAVEPNHVYVIPPGADLVIARGELIPSPREPHGQHRPVEFFLRTLAEDQGHAAIGVILSGGASDGTLGLEEIKAAGGITFAQDASAQQESMPLSARGTGCVDYVLSPAGIAGELSRIARHPYVAPDDDERGVVLPGADILPLLDLLHRTHGVDFSHYKRSTLFRRISRRMLLHKIDGLEDYTRLLEESLPEQEALYQDILINVTSFFRNPEAYDALKADVFPALVEGRARNDPVRIWVLGCSTGEEAYSLAIALSEYLEASRLQIPMQIFATDLNGACIERARTGVYSRGIAQDVSPERLRRYFVEAEGAYRVRKSLRDVCVFARHNVLTEPPFSRIDLVTCRNLLIYLGQEMQQRIIPILHYALRPRGLLWLGKSETIGAYRDLFDLETPEHKFYRKRPPGGRFNLGPVVQGLRRAAPGSRAAVPPVREAPAPALEIQKEADRLLLARFAPASVLVNADFDILQFRGNTGLFLTPAPGRASLNLLKMLREGLLLPVRACLQTARKGDAPVRKDGLRVKTNGDYQDLSIEVLPVRADASMPWCYMILFELSRQRPDAAPAKGPKAKAAPAAREREEQKTSELKQELATTREYLQSVIEQQEAANEELQSANEEVQSANEELQSINEELETSKEEIQSTNEELATVNEELNHRNLELAQTNNDLINLLSSVQMAIVIVSADLRIRRFTPAAEHMLNLIPADIGRPISDLNLKVPVPDFERKLTEVIETMGARDFEITGPQGRWHSLRLRPYRTLDHKIEGVVIIMVDIDSVKRGVEMLNRQAQMMDQAHEPMLIWQHDGEISYWNNAAEAVYGYTREQAIGSRPRDLLAVPRAREIDEALNGKGLWSGNITHRRSDGRSIEVFCRMVLVREADGRAFVIEANRLLDGAAGGGSVTGRQAPAA